MRKTIRPIGGSLLLKSPADRLRFEQGKDGSHVLVDPTLKYQVIGDRLCYEIPGILTDTGEPESAWSDVRFCDETKQVCRDLYPEDRRVLATYSQCGITPDDSYQTKAESFLSTCKLPAPLGTDYAALPVIGATT